jgi:C-terminal domain on Strawberry notch homologue
VVTIADQRRLHLQVLSEIIDLLELPPNPLDNLVHLCGGREVVAEMTGRKFIMEIQKDGRFKKARCSDLWFCAWLIWCLFSAVLQHAVDHCSCHVRNRCSSLFNRLLSQNHSVQLSPLLGPKEVLLGFLDAICTQRAWLQVQRATNEVAQSGLNISEKDKFMDGEKRIAIISDAASTGISLQARACCLVAICAIMWCTRHCLCSSLAQQQRACWLQHRCRWMHRID